MSKRIVICADGTWNRPEEDPKKDFPTNVLKLARAVQPVADDQVPQQVFYDWGVGSYYERVKGGVTGKGLTKNVMDDYRYIVQNYAPGDELYLFGFSRGAYTVRSLCGLIHNCGILKRENAHLIQRAFEHYKRKGRKYSPKGAESVRFREAHSHPSREVKFIGVWDTVGALGVPISFLGFLDPEDEFYDSKMGPNVRIGRHALAIDELREDFEPTIWLPRENLDLRQVWFAGAHSDVGGSQEPDRADGSLLSDITLDWMMREATVAGLKIEPHLRQNLRPNYKATLHRSRRYVYRYKRPLYRPINHGKGEVFIHSSVKRRWDDVDTKYRPKNLAHYLDEHDGWPARLLD